MTKTNCILLIAIALLIPVAMAQDFNSMTSEQMQAYIQQQVRVAQQTQQPQITTIQMDSDLLDRLDRIQRTVTETKNEVGLMQGRFNTLSTNMENQIVNQAVGVIQQSNEDRQAQFNDNRKIMKDFINYATNPVRTNLPIVGVLLICSGAFLFWASKQYKLTEGARHPVGPTEPNTLQGTGKLLEDKKPKEKPAEKEKELETQKPKKKWIKIPVKTFEITETDQIMQSSLPMTTKIKLLKQLEGDQ